MEDIFITAALVVFMGPVVLGLAGIWLRMCWWAFGEAWKSWGDEP